MYAQTNSIDTHYICMHRFTQDQTASPGVPASAAAECRSGSPGQISISLAIPHLKRTTREVLGSLCFHSLFKAKPFRPANGNATSTSTYAQAGIQHVTWLRRSCMLREVPCSTYSLTGKGSWYDSQIVAPITWPWTWEFRWIHRELR